MKKTVRFFALITAAALAASAAVMHALASEQAEMTHVGLLYIEKENDDEPFIGSGVAFKLKEGGAVVESIYENSGGETNIKFISSRDTYDGTIESGGSIKLEKISDNDPVFLQAATPVEGQTATMECLCLRDDEFVTETVPVVLSDFRINGGLLMNVDEVPDDVDLIMYPAPILNDGGGCVGYLIDDNTAMADWITSEEDLNGAGGAGGTGGGTPGGSGEGTNSASGGTNIYVIIGAVILIAVIAAIFAKSTVVSRKKTYDSSQPDFSDIEHDFENDYKTEDIMPDTESVTIPANDRQQKYTLKCVGGYMDGRTYTINGNEITIGRGVGSVISYPDDTKGVSRKHCKLFIFDGMLMLMDVGSSFGTFLDGKGRLLANAPVPVKKGDAFCVGDSRNRFIIV